MKYSEDIKQLKNDIRIENYLYYQLLQDLLYLERHLHQDLLLQIIDCNAHININYMEDHLKIFLYKIKLTFLFILINNAYLKRCLAHTMQ